MSSAEQTVEPTLTRRAVSGTAWSTLATVGRQVLSFASVATVARLLGPKAYGVMGMANLLIVFILVFRDLGTGTAIIQRLSISNRLLSSLFWVNCLLGMAMSLAVVGVSPLAAAFFHTHELIPILSTLSLSFWLTSCGIVQSSILRREMRFKTLAVVDLVSGLISYLVALSFAFTGFGVWSLVFANLANSVAATLMYWFASEWRPSREFDAAEVKSVVGFSLNLSGFGVVNYFGRNADNIIVGKLLGQAQLGDYQMAYNLMLTPIQNISSVMAQVTLPAFARIQDDNERFCQAYIRSCMMIGLITFPVMAGLGIVADPLIRALLGAKWVGAILIFQILAPVGLVQSVQTTIGQIFVAKGRTDWFFWWGMVSAIIFVIAFLIGVRFGTAGVAAAYCIVYIGVLMVPGFWIPFRLIGLKLSRFANALLAQLLITAAMTAVCGFWLFGLHRLGIFNPWIGLVSTSVLGALVYVAALVLLRPRVMEVMEEIMEHYGNPMVTRSLRVLRAITLRDKAYRSAW